MIHSLSFNFISIELGPWLAAAAAFPLDRFSVAVAICGCCACACGRVSSCCASFILSSLAAVDLTATWQHSLSTYWICSCCSCTSPLGLSDAGRKDSKAGLCSWGGFGLGSSA